MQRIESPWHRISINEPAVRAALEPVIDDYIESLKAAAWKNGIERTRIMDACDTRLLNRLNDIADEHGIVRELRGQFFAVVAEIKEDRAMAALAVIREAALRPRVVIIKQTGGCAPVALVVVLVGLLAIML